MTPAKQVVPKQHPFAHEVALHSHDPLTHCWPAAHSGPLPQLHAPLAQPSDSVGSHDVQALPPVPQVVCDGVSHVLPLQHPEVHVIEHPAHAWFRHAPPLPQLTHCEPLPPHAVACVPVWQTPLVSQHPAQLVALHTHIPLTHERPLPHAGLLPQVH